MYFQWSSAFNIGVPRIDRQHQRLAELLNEFHGSCSLPGPDCAVYPVLNALVRYAEEHFRGEEALMEETRYPESLRQKREHEKFAFAIFAFNERLQARGAEVAEEALSFVKNWLLDHILQMDRKMGDYLRDRGIPPHWQQDEP
jgi:hemerythrin-like metal-binding protein